MDKQEIKTLIREKRSKINDLGDKALKSNNVEEIRKINSEINGVHKEIYLLEDELDQLDDTIAIQRNNGIPPLYEGQSNNIPQYRSSSPQGNLNILGTYSTGNSSNSIQRSDNFMIDQDTIKLYEQRGKDLKDKRKVDFNSAEIFEQRSTTVSSSNLVVPNQYSNTLNPAFNPVSSIVDLVHIVPLQGGESYQKGFVKAYGEGDYTAETADYTDTDPVMDYVTIGKSKITAYTEMSDESIKLPNVDYQAEVAKNITTAIKRKIAQEIIIGLGGSNSITGIFHAPENVIPVSSDVSMATIDADTLDNLVIGYGGDEDVEGATFLILNKKDLAAFAAVRDSDGKKLYKIKKNGNTGTISSDDSFEIPFVINSSCAALTDTNTTSGSYCMAYGKILGYELPVFSQLTVEESRDYKFKSGQICYRGSIWTGGNVALYKGFTRVKKA